MTSLELSNLQTAETVFRFMHVFLVTFQQLKKHKNVIAQVTRTKLTAIKVSLLGVSSNAKSLQIVNNIKHKFLLKPYDLTFHASLHFLEAAKSVYKFCIHKNVFSSKTKNQLAIDFSL